MEKFYAVFNTSDGEFVRVGVMDKTLTQDKEIAKSLAAHYNRAMKPEHQAYTVVTVIFDSEV